MFTDAFHSFIHSFIADTYTAPITWDYSEAPPTPPNNVALSCLCVFGNIFFITHMYLHSIDSNHLLYTFLT